MASANAEARKREAALKDELKGARERSALGRAALTKTLTGKHADALDAQRWGPCRS